MLVPLPTPATGPAELARLVKCLFDVTQSHGLTEFGRPLEELSDEEIARFTAAMLDLIDKEGNAIGWLKLCRTPANPDPFPGFQRPLLTNGPNFPGYSG